MNTSLLHLLAKNWWLFLLRGIAAIVFGILAFMWPALTLVTLVLLFGAYALVDGVFALIAAFRRGEGVPRGWLVLTGLLGLAAAATTLFYPGFTALALVLFIGSWSIVRGVFEIVGAIQLRKEITGEWLLILSGLMSILFGVIVFIAPGAGALALVWLIAIYSIVFGALLTGLAFRVRRYRSDESRETDFPAHSHPA
jgi:uncharacterized membrane protein HdeD (DUF308 family)